MVEISQVLEVTDIDSIYIERSYYLAPDSKAAGAPFAVIREGLAGKAAVGRLALHGREYLVAILPHDKALMLFTLRTAGEVRTMDSIQELDFATSRVKPEEIKLARQVLASFETDADLLSFTDNYQEALRAMLEKKGAGEPIDVVEKGKPAKVANLMDALRKSLDQVSREKKRPAQAGVRKTARIVKHPSSRTSRRAS